MNSARQYHFGRMHDSRSKMRAAGEKFWAGVFLPLFRETLPLWGIGECVVARFAWGNCKGLRATDASEAGEGQRLGA
jgi:hypothetical protein